VKLGALSLTDLHAQLRRGGLWFRVGPLVLHLRSPLEDLAEALHFSYGDFPLVEPEEFADFHIQIVPRRRLRGWWAPEVEFLVDHTPAMKPLPRALAAPMLEWGLNWCIAVHVHQYLLIHAAVLERDGRGLLLPAGSGSGKSTLCAGLALAGWRLLSDEVALVRPADGQLAPLPRPVSLKNTSIEVVRAFSSNAPILARWQDPVDGLWGEMRPSADSVARAGEPAMPAWVVFPKYESKSPTRSRRCPKGVAFMELANNAPNYSLLGRQGFETLARLVDACDCYQFQYSDLREAVQRFASLPPPVRLPQSGQADEPTGIALDGVA
jgi:HprK-related kinase A